MAEDTRAGFAALIGAPNAGKSTLMNALTEAGVLAENRLFSTLDTRTRPWRLSGGRTVLLSDTVGFIRKLPHQLVASFHATLEEALNADLLFLVIDGSNPEAIEHVHTVERVLETLDADHIPRIYVINKRDRIDDMSILAPLHRHGGHSVLVSARRHLGFDELATAVQDFLAQTERVVTMLIPHTAGSLHAELRSAATILAEHYVERGCVIDAQIGPTMLGRAISQGAERWEGPDARTLANGD